MRLGVLLTSLALAGCGTVHNTVRDGADERLILRGNDAVAYFTEGKPVPGNPAIKSEFQGDTYRFASAAHKKMFDADPAKYAPAYTGFCASGAPYALKANIGARVHTLYKGRLYLFGSERSRANWLVDADANVRLGDDYWEKETRDMPHRLQNWKRYLFKVPHYKTDDELDAERLRRSAR
ncbi:MAG: YHS domain-containing protein [Betaproteobacteria bacterium]|nr:YHS domain-containing protein [Betaproteobacteria bacterium]MDH4324229.1 YHS domain-containing protein [Betaproteobacteria bacterium]MDH5210660.1 YHS domain-containing protein [Betaproteobacteria bacterium]